MFPKTVRNQIIVSTAAVTLIIAAITVTICFSVFQSFLRKAEIQSAEFNMQVISNNVSADMDHIGAAAIQKSITFCVFFRIRKRCLPSPLPIFRFAQ